MDPLSITAGAVALAAQVLRSAAFVREAVDQFRDAPALARDIEHETKIVQAALRQVENALQRDPQAIRRLVLYDVFELSVEGCWDTLQEMTREFETLFGRHDWRLRLAVWWNSGDIRRLLGRLETKKGSLMLLVQALSLHSVQEMQELLQQNMRTLDIARLGLDAMVPSYPAYTARDLDSTASAIGSGDSVLGDRESVVSDTRFIFDDICFDSKPYRHAVARVSAKKQSHRRRGSGTASPGGAALPAVRETEAETHIPALRETSPPVQPAGVTPEEHEAVVRKLREAEALIRTLRGHMRPPETVSREHQRLPGPSQYVFLAEDIVNVLLKDLPKHPEHLGDSNHGQGVERRTEAIGGSNMDLYIAPETAATINSHRGESRRAEGTRDVLPEKNMTRRRSKAAIQPVRKASSAIDQASALPDGFPAAAGSTRVPSPHHPRGTPYQRDIARLPEYFEETKDENGYSKPSINIHFTPRDEGKLHGVIVKQVNTSKPAIQIRLTPREERKPRRGIIVTRPYNETTQPLDADNGREITSTGTEHAPTALVPADQAATLCDPSRQLPAADGMGERPLPGDISPLLSQTRTRSAITRTPNPIFGYGTPGAVDSGNGTRIEATHTTADKTTDMPESWLTLGQLHGSRTAAARNPIPSYDPEHLEARIVPDSHALGFRQTMEKLFVEHTAEQSAPEIKGSED